MTNTEQIMCQTIFYVLTIKNMAIGRLHTWSRVPFHFPSSISLKFSWVITVEMPVDKIFLNLC